MAKKGNGVSGKTHTSQQVDHYANQYNPNNAAHSARVANEAATKGGGKGGGKGKK